MQAQFTEDGMILLTRDDGTQCYVPDDEANRDRQMLTDWEAAGNSIGPYVPPPAPPYQISKTTPWLRMTDDEAELITGAMQQANARQKAIYDAASYLSSGDPLWGTLHDMIATTLGSAARAAELLAPET